MTSTARIGDPTSRIDGPAKVTGAARYAAEHHPDGLLYGWVVSSAIAKGRIASIDDAEARALPGVVDVVTHENRPSLAWLDRSYADEVAPPGSPFRALHDEKIAFSAQPVALVVAETLEAARDGAGLVRIRYDADAHNTDLEAALPEKFEPKKKRSHFQMPKSRGDAEAALAAAPRRIAATYRTGTHHHHPMEMHATTVVWEGGGKLTVHDKTQGPQNVQAYLASALGIAKGDLRVRNAFVGGAFGSGLRPQYHVLLAALAATKLERSVRVGLTRQQMVTHVHRPPAIQDVRLGAAEDGRLQAIVNDATTSTSRYENYMEVVCNWGLMAYACENAKGTYTIAPLDTPTPGDMRAPGATTGMTLFEMAIDEMAYAAGVDPLELRLVNYTDKDEMSGRPYSSKALREAYAQGAERFGWQRRSAAPRSMKDGRELVGWGVATGMWDALFQSASCRARLDLDGRLEVASAASDIGTGTCTVMAIVAADALGLPIAQISVELGDSDLPTAPVEGGSWMAASVGAAVHAACLAIGGRLYECAKQVPGRPLGDAKFSEVAFEDGAIVVKADPSRRVAYADAMRAAGKTLLEAEQSVGPGLGDMIGMMLKARNTHSAVFAEVKVDEELGVVRVTRIVNAVAAGRIVNPKTARSQVLGGVVMGIGMALHEESYSDHRFGRFMNHNLAEYHIPAHADIDSIEVIFVDERDDEVSPLGLKGVGEIGIVSTAAAVANAIFHATGKRVRELPVTIDKLL